MPSVCSENVSKSAIKEWCTRLFLCLLCYVVGDTLLHASWRGGEDMGYTFLEVVGRKFEFGTYSFDYITWAILWNVGLIILADMFTPGKLRLSLLCIIAFFTGVYEETMWGYNYFVQIDTIQWTGLLRDPVPDAVATSIGLLVSLTFVLMVPITVIVVKFMAGDLRPSRKPDTTLREKNP